jgi:Uma2 family endonuclease
MTALPTLRPSATKPPLPPLQNGDVLNRDEFERRYDAMPPVVKAELIEGVVYVASPVSDPFHAGPHFDLIGWMAMYRFATPGVVGGDNGTIRLDLDNEPQPDVYLRIRSEYGGQSQVDKDNFVRGAPELVAEVAASSAAYDLHAKLNAYRRNRVLEYIVWRTYDEVIDWFSLRGGRYEPLPPGPDGIFRSEVFPGLWLDAPALLRGDVATVLGMAQQGIASPEHAAFVERLRAALQAPKS